MSSDQNTEVAAEVNPPAFPQHKWIREDIHTLSGAWVWCGGMSLLDWYAGQALPAMMRNHPGEALSDVAVLAYDQAEQMLAERTRREGQQP